MIVFNTTYHVPSEETKNFLIWMYQYYLPKVKEFGYLTEPRISKLLSHKEPGSVCYALEFKVESSARLHYWYNHQGNELEAEMEKVFNKQVNAFATIMEIIEETSL